MTAKGLSLPIKTDRRGGFAQIEGVPYIRQLIAVALGDDDSDNEFQDLGLGARPIFGNVSDEGLKDWIRNRVRQLMDEFRTSGLAQLKSFNFIEGDQDSGELVGVLHYIDLESDTPDQVQVTFPVGG